jgi:hypothetical protein
MKKHPIFAIGQVLGTKAFNQGLKRIPATDVELMNHLANEAGSKQNIAIMKGWLFGWDNANLSKKVN